VSNAYKRKKAVEINQPPFGLSEQMGHYADRLKTALKMNMGKIHLFLIFRGDT